MDRKEARAWCLGLALTMLLLVGQRVRQHDTVLVYDEFSYARSSSVVTASVREVIHPQDDTADREEALRRMGKEMFQRGRPPFYWPGAVTQGLLGRSWTISATLFVTMIFWLGLLFLALHRLMRRLAGDDPVAGALVFATIVLGAEFWISATRLMGDLPVASAFTCGLWVVVAIHQRGALRDYLAFGLVLALGLLTKPIFGFFGVPLVAVVAFLWLRRLLRKTEPRPTAVWIGASFVAMALPPSILAYTQYEPLLAQVRQLTLMNETLAYYQSAGDVVQRAAWFPSATMVVYPVVVLPLIVMAWFLGLARRAGRYCWILFFLLCAYATFLVEHRGARHFLGLFILLGISGGLGVACLPKRVGGWYCRITAGVALVFAFSGAWALESLNESVFARRVFAYQSEGKNAGWSSHLRAPILDRSEPEYRDLRIPDVLERSRLLEDPKATFFAAYSTQSLNWTSYQSWLYLKGIDGSYGRRVFANTFRYGGFGDEGGLSSHFFSASFVGVKSGMVWGTNPETEIYHRLITTAMSTEGNPLQAGLAYREALETEGEGKVFLFERLRLPSHEEWVQIVRWLATVDPDNPWNARWAHEVLKSAHAETEPAVATEAAQWILSFAQDPAVSSRLHERFVYRDSFPLLKKTYDESWAAARAHLAK